MTDEKVTKDNNELVLMEEGMKIRPRIKLPQRSTDSS
jgi:hypothetical protein